MLDTHLLEFGLSEKESSAYLALLEMGSSTADQVAKVTELNRSSTYAVLESLVANKFATMNADNEPRTYAAISPENLLERANNLAKTNTSIQKNIDAVLPDLLALSQNLKNKPRVLFFEGVEGIKTVYQEVSSSKEEVDMFFDLRTTRGGIPKGLFTKNTRVISPQINNQVSGERAAQSLEKIRYVPEKQYDFASDLYIYTNKVGFTSRNEDFAVIIESQDVADVMRELFSLAWDEAGRLDTGVKIK